MSATPEGAPAFRRGADAAAAADEALEIGELLSLVYLSTGADPGTQLREISRLVVDAEGGRLDVRTAIAHIGVVVRCGADPHAGDEPGTWGATEPF